MNLFNASLKEKACFSAREGRFSRFIILISRQVDKIFRVIFE